MKDCLLILGNGFDLDLGLKTSYSAFWTCAKWQTTKTTCPEQYLITSLDNYRISNNWFDMESGLEHGARRLKNRLSSNENVDRYKESFKILKNELKEYISEQQALFTPIKNCVAEQILDAISLSGYKIIIYTFNYTDLDIIGEKIQKQTLSAANHLHGSLNPNDDIILGIELDDISSIPPQLSFLIKSNSSQYHYNNLLKDLEMSDEIIFFGHSINGMDFPYFKDFFEDLAIIPIKESGNKHITIITYDETSAMQIKDNLRRNNIDVRNLFNRVALEFIMTKSIYDGNPNEIAKLEKLKSKISIIH